ncbi:MAG: tetratricopeptide repeat protein [Pseudomonadota bacterium]
MSYGLSARNNDQVTRPHLLSPWVLVGFAVAIVFVLLMIFPKQDLLRQAARERLGDPLTVSYLSNLLHTSPHNLELRLLLAEHKLFLGELDEVADLIAPALQSKDAEWQKRGLLLQYKYLTKLYQKSPLRSAQRAELAAQRHATFLRLSARKWSLLTLIYLAGQANELKERGIVTLLYRAIDDAAAGQSTDWIAATARRVLGEGDFELSVHLYFLARNKAHSVADQREFLLAGIKILMANGRYGEAMQAADRYVGKLIDDPDTLYFLVRAARASNDPERAARYARRMLNLSWLEQLYLRVVHLDFELIPSAHAAEEDMTPGDDSKIRPYDAQKYKLAYEVFLANRNLHEAFRVAEAAVRQAPQETVWHQRLSQVAEWTNHTAIALREWRWLMRHQGNEEAVLAVMRLAPALGDYDAALEAWQRVATTRKLDEKQGQALADMFELAGRQHEGIRFFQARYRATHQPWQLELAARMAQRSGNIKQAYLLYAELLQKHGFNQEWILNTVNLDLQQGDYQKAYERMQQYSSLIPESDHAYWKLLADLAWQLQKDDVATEKYRQLAANSKMAQGDFSRLLYLLGKSRPEESATVAEQAFRLHHAPEMLFQALEIHVRQQDLAAQRRLYASIDAQTEASLSSYPRFYLMRGQYFQAIGDQQAAHHDFRHAAALAPQDPNTVNTILWFLIDAHDLPGLREMLSQLIERNDQLDPAYWGVLAASYQVLDQPARAVAYYALELQRHQKDYLWLLNYADALEQNRQGGMAWRVRRYAWLQLRDKQVMQPWSPQMQAAARLALMNHAADEGLTLVRSVLRQDKLVQHDQENDRVTEMLVLGWALSHEQSAAAKAWLWQRYGRAMQQPLWAESMIAMADDDTQRLNDLLATQADGMTMLTRHDAAQATGQEGLAQSIVFEGLQDDPENGDAHQRLSEDVLQAASTLDVGLASVRLGDWSGNVMRTRLETPLTAHTRLGLEYLHTGQSDAALTTPQATPGLELMRGISLLHRAKSGRSELTVQRRSEYADTTALLARHEWSPLPRLEVAVDAQRHAAATESNELRVFGMRDQFETSFQYRLSRREYLRLQPGVARYQTQLGSALGNGRHLAWEAGYQVRAEYPDVTVRVTGYSGRYSSDGNAAFALPGNTDLFGVCAGSGAAERWSYTRAWRLYGDACMTRNSVSGQGYNAALGLAGSLLGPDLLSLAFSQEFGGTNLVNGMSRELKLNYRYYFDR